MTTSRYTERELFTNTDPGYVESIFDKRDVQQILQYNTARFYYPTIQERQAMSMTPKIWTSTSRLYNLAATVYGDSRLWWVLAWFNQKPTEAHFKVGDVYYVPDSPAEIIRFFKKQNGDF
tara:strand:- start:83 stop:442 length:360 start_codon:yes stop_codon:yes gene_type:complete